jgi:O-antigen ligase
MIVWGLCWLLEKKNTNAPIWDQGSGIFILFLAFIVYYLWQCAGLIFSSDLKMGFSNAFGRLSLLAFPLILSSPGKLIRKRAGVLLKIFASCTVMFMLGCYIFALYRSLSLKEGVWIFDHHVPDYPWLSYFFGSDLAFSIHPSYLAMYVLFSAFITFEAGFQNMSGQISRIFWFASGLFLIVSLYFISSRAGILGGILVIPVYFYIRLRNRKGSKLTLLTILAALIISIPLLLKNQRVQYLYDRFTRQETVGENRQEPRMIIWKSSFRLIKKNILLGVGIGDVRNELVSEYENLGEAEMAQKRLNAHNQFIEVFLENGIIGLTLFLFLLSLMVYIALKDKNLIYGIFLFIILLFFMFETILYRLAGVSFFALFSFLLAHAGVPEKPE